MINERVQGCIADTLTDMLTCNQTIQTIENNHLVANCLYIKALQQKPDNLTILTFFLKLLIHHLISPP